MSRFNKGGGTAVGNRESQSVSPAPLRTVMAGFGNRNSRHSSPTPSSSRTSTPQASMTSTPRGSLAGSLASRQTTPSASPIAKRQLRMDTDPETCFEVFKSHWQQARAIMNKANLSPSLPIRRSPHEDVEAVIRYVDQMMLLLIEEEEQEGGQGPILQFLLMEDILEKLLAWSAHSAEHADQLKIHQLKMYDLIITQSQQDLLVHKPVIRPLLKLLGSCKENPNTEVERFLVLILHQLCVCVTQYKQILELLFDASPQHGPARFLVFSLLITYIHKEGDVGQQARDALLLIMSLSSQHDDIGRYIAANSDFCPVLATGLSGLYSSLPRKLDYPSDDWYQVSDEDIVSMPDLVMFLNSLEFCNAVVQVAHPLVAEQLLLFIYNGFLVPVLGPALHQTSMEEVIAATAYLELFIRRVSEPSLIRIFLQFILTSSHDDVNILDSLIMRINSNSRLCMVTLSLFRTLVELNCEDVLFQLVFKYLIPCNHVMVSQRRAVKDIDLYSKTAEKLLSLRPACCMVELAEPVMDGSSTSVPPRSIHISRSPSPEVSGHHITQSQDGSTSLNSQLTGNGTSLAHDTFESSYIEYLKAVRSEIARCKEACHCWSLPYDGDNPSIDSLTGATTMTSLPGANSSDGKLVTENMDKNENTLYTDGRIRQQCIVENGGDFTKSSVSSVSSLHESQSSNDNVTEQVVITNLQKQYTQLTYAESITSDVDSAFSGSSTQTDNLQTSMAHSPVRTDSPLNDQFDNAEFGAFLLSLKRVKTPVEYSDSIEESFNEIETIASGLKHMSNSGSKSTSTDTTGTLGDHSAVSTPLPGFEDAENTENKSTDPSHKTSDSDPIQSSESSTVILTPDNCKNAVNGFVSEAVDVLHNSPPLITPLKQSAKTPSVGPFLSTLLSRLEQMMQNTLYVNLLLTGIITRLACYPQPLLRSFLLNHTLVFQPTVKSLIQVLGSVKQKVDCFALTVKTFDDMLVKARRFLLWREELYLHSIGELPGRRDSAASFPGALGRQQSTEPHREKRNALKELFRRNPTSIRTKSRANDPRLQLLGDKRGFRYINQKSPGSPTHTMADQLEALKTKNAVYCALVLDEFLKELAAVSQEHPVVCV